MQDHTFQEAVANQRMLYERTGRIGARPSINLVGLRSERPCVSVSCCPSSPVDMINKVAAATMVLSSLEVDEACLAVGDEWAELVLHPDDLQLPADGYAAVVVAGGRPRGVVRPYRYDRAAGRIHWAPSRDLCLSLSESLWAERLAPQALKGGTGRKLTRRVADVVAFNQELDNEVLILDGRLGQVLGHSLN